MSTISNDVKLTMKFQDDTSRTYTFPNIPSSVLTGVATGIRNINSSLPSATGETPIASFKQLFISDDTEDGISPVVKISGAKIVSKQEEIIYGN